MYKMFKFTRIRQLLFFKSNEKCRGAYFSAACTFGGYQIRCSEPCIKNHIELILGDSILAISHLNKNLSPSATTCGFSIIGM